MYCRHASENKRIDLFDGPGGGDVFAEENVQLASCKYSLGDLIKYLSIYLKCELKHAAHMQYVIKRIPSRYVY